MPSQPLSPFLYKTIQPSPPQRPRTHVSPPIDTPPPNHQRNSTSTTNSTNISESQQRGTRTSCPHETSIDRLRTGHKPRPEWPHRRRRLQFGHWRDLVSVTRALFDENEDDVVDGDREVFGRYGEMSEQQGVQFVMPESMNDAGVGKGGVGEVAQHSRDGDRGEVKDGKGQTPNEEDEGDAGKGE